MLNSLSRGVFFAGLFLFPLLHFPQAANGFEGPKVFFFQRWVEILAVLSLFSRTKGIASKISWLLLAYFFWNLITSLAGSDPATSLFGLPWRGQGLIMLAHYLALAMIIPGLQIEIRRFGLVLMLAAVGELGYLLISYASKYFFDRPLYLYLGRAVGTFGNPNFLAGFLVVCLPFAIFLKRWWGIVLAVVILAAIVLTRSEGALLALAIVATIAFLFWRKAPVPIISGLVVTLAIISAAVYFLKMENSPTFLAESRWRIYGRGILAAARRPLTGYGLENYELAVAGIDWPREIQPESEVRTDKAHNEVLEVLLASGVVGLGLWGTIVVLVTKNLYYQKAYVLLLAFLIFLFKAQTNVVSTVEYALFWIVVGLATGRNPP